MSSTDAIAASSLGALPSESVDLSTRTGRELHDAIQNFMRDIERDRRLLLAIVLEGPELFYKRMHGIWRKFDREMCAAIHGYFVLQAGQNVEAQLATLNRAEVARNLHWDKRLRTVEQWDGNLRRVLEAVRHEKRVKR